KEVFNFDVASPQSFKYSADGSYLLGSSYYSGVSNIFKVDTNTLDIEILTNALTGYFRPVPIDDEKIFSFKYTSNGFAPVYIYNEENVEENVENKEKEIDENDNVVLEESKELIVKVDGE
ncbi:MAG: hypothetical protein IH784_10200, partial [Bacteroidetes bacterium]|nr:hypothetical protein [Bacteroidota bacterium]